MKKLGYLIVAIMLSVFGSALWFQSQKELDSVVISTVGDFPMDKSASIHVFRADNDLLNIKYSIDGSKQEWIRGFIDPNSDWFLYVHRRNEIWLVENQDAMLIFDFDGASGSYGLFNCHDPKVLNEFIYARASDRLREMLPEELSHRIAEAKSSGHVMKTDEVFVAAAPRK